MMNSLHLKRTSTIDVMDNFDRNSNQVGYSSIKNWAEEDRPREKMIEKGEQALSNAELLAILIGSGTTKKSAVELMKEVMDSCENRLSRLGTMSIEELMMFNGIGQAKAVTIKAAAEIGRRRANENINDLNQIKSSDDVYNIMYPHMRDITHEEFWALLLNQNSRLLKKVKLSSGGMTDTAVDIRMLMKEALIVGATQMIVCHNHPSGSMRPSNEDISLTEKIKEASQLLKIRLVDHVIVTDGAYYSFAEKGKI